MERFSDKEIKNYSNYQKKRIEHLIMKEKENLWGLIRMTPMEVYQDNCKYNFMIRNLINLIKAKIDKLHDKDLSEEESIKLINQFDKDKILKKYVDKFHHWRDRARDTYELPTSYEWTIQPSIK